MRELKRYNDEGLLFFDIETARVVKELEEGTPLYDSWKYKVEKSGEKSVKEVKESFKNEAGLYPEFARVVTIVAGKIIDKKIKLITFDDLDEAKLLSGFNDLLNRRSGDVLTGFVNIGFDTPFVFKRMLINGIVPNDKLDSSGLKPWEVEELDLSKFWQATSFTRASLINIATAFGLPSPKDDISGKDVGDAFWRGETARISKYCRKDVETTINIYKKMKLESPIFLSEEDEFGEDPYLISLFNGADYDEEELYKYFDKLTPDERVKGYEILNALVSTAKMTKTKFTKTDLKNLKSKYE